MADNSPRTETNAPWSGGFSPTLALSPDRSRLQAAVLVALTCLPLALPPLLDLPALVVFGWCAMHVGAGALEAWRCGLLDRRRRVCRIRRQGQEWVLHYGDGRAHRGPLARTWSTGLCAYLELDGPAGSGGSCLIWRDALPREAFRHLRVHLRLG